MLVHLLVWAIDENNRNKPDPGMVATATYSKNLIDLFQNNRAETNALKNRMTYKCAEISMDRIDNWNKKMETLYPSFSILSNKVVYWQKNHEGWLMVTECLLPPTWSPNTGGIGSTGGFLNAVFFIQENSETRTYEVLCLPPSNATQAAAVYNFGVTFFEVIQQLDINPKRPPIIPAVEQPISFWKRMIRRFRRNKDQ